MGGEEQDQLHDNKPVQEEDVCRRNLAFCPPVLFGEAVSDDFGDVLSWMESG